MEFFLKFEQQQKKSDFLEDDEEDTLTPELENSFNEYY